MPILLCIPIFQICQIFQNLEQEKLKFHKEIDRANKGAKDRMESTKRLLNDCINRLIEPMQEKLKEINQEKVLSLEKRLQEQKGWYEGITRAKDDAREKAKQVKEQLTELREQVAITRNKTNTVRSTC